MAISKLLTRMLTTRYSIASVFDSTCVVSSTKILMIFGDTTATCRAASDFELEPAVMGSHIDPGEYR